MKSTPGATERDAPSIRTFVLNCDLAFRAMNELTQSTHEPRRVREPVAGAAPVALKGTAIIGAAACRCVGSVIGGPSIFDCPLETAWSLEAPLTSLEHGHPREVAGRRWVGEMPSCAGHPPCAIQESFPATDVPSMSRGPCPGERRTLLSLYIWVANEAAGRYAAPLRMV